MVRAPARSTAVQNMLDYSYCTRNGKFKRLGPHFQHTAMWSASKKGTETTVVALPHSRECTKEPISPLTNFGSKEKFGARAELRNILQETLRGSLYLSDLHIRGGFGCRFDRKNVKTKCGQCTTGEHTSTTRTATAARCPVVTPPLPLIDNTPNV